MSVTVTVAIINSYCLSALHSSIVLLVTWCNIPLRNVYDTTLCDIPANTKHLYNICTTSAQRLRR